jgi:hypothetical protein
MHGVSLSWISLPCFLALLAPGSGCSDSQFALDDKSEERSWSTAPQRDVDILFVLDNSGSMTMMQDRLRATFPQFLERLAAPDGLPNLHVGVVTTDLGTRGGAQIGACTAQGDDGRLRRLPESPDQYFLSDIADPATGARTTNYQGSLANALTQLADQGSQGCGYEAPLAAMRRALTHPDNASFLRPEASLAVLIFSNEDDCSLRSDAALDFFAQSDLQLRQSVACFDSSTICDGDPLTSPANCRPNEASRYHESVASFVESLRQIKPDQRLAVAGIIGTPAPVQLIRTQRNGQTVADLEASCSFEKGGIIERAFPGVRLNAFLQAFPRHLQSSICDDVGAPMNSFAELVRDAMPSSCFAGKVSAPARCTVSETTNVGTPQELRTELAACSEATGARPCWQLRTDQQRCSAGAHQMIDVQRDGAAPPNAQLSANCVVE